MITARLLNSEAQINNYKTVGGLTFVNEDTIRVVIQLYNDEFGIRHMPAIDSTLSLQVNDSTGGFHKLPMANLVEADDRSIWFVDIRTDSILGNASNHVLVGGNVTFELLGDTPLPGGGARGIIFNALQRLIIS